MRPLDIICRDTLFLERRGNPAVSPLAPLMAAESDPTPELVAVLDMGASAIRLVVAEVSPNRPARTIDEASRGVLLGVSGLSTNIEVISIVDRFLEHARVYYFLNGGDDQVYLYENGSRFDAHCGATGFCGYCAAHHAS